jgi:hypothetical protein
MIRSFQLQLGDVWCEGLAFEVRYNAARHRMTEGRGLMLLFHGTTEPFIDGILSEGLKPQCDPYHDDDWPGRLTGMGRASHVYLSTRPVAGKGGDPIAFAMDWKRRVMGWSEQPPDGYVVVVELDDNSLDPVRYVIANQDLDRFVEVMQLRDLLAAGDSTISRGCWLHLLRISKWLEDNRIKPTHAFLRRHLASTVLHADLGLPAGLTPERWCEFLRAYFRLVDYEPRRTAADVVERRRRKLMADYGICFPEHFEEDEHCVTCPVCIGGLYRFAYRFSPPAQTRQGGRFEDAYLPKLVADRLPELLRIARAHFASHPVPRMESFLRTRQRTFNWAEWYEQFPPDRSRLPRVWDPDFGKQVDLGKLRCEDTQALCGAIPIDRVVGAIRVSSGRRLLPGVRSSRQRGSTLASNLWRLAYALRGARGESPVRVDDPQSLTA